MTALTWQSQRLELFPLIVAQSIAFSMTIILREPTRFENTKP
jgi:hypothetical protein